MDSRIEWYYAKVVEELFGGVRPAGREGEEMLAALTYILYLVNIFDDAGITYRGDNYKYQGQINLLVVKATIDDNPVVTFINAMTRQQAVKIFLDQLGERRVLWYPDKWA